ncbi:MAG: uracil-DNA glycosylase family protein [Betaproteobacteria bacterium]
MTHSPVMPSEYLALARERAEARHPRYKQPEDFGYNFQEWVSPYTKGAHKIGSVALVLQDWASEAALTGPMNCQIREYGRNPTLRTNVRLAHVVEAVLGLSLADVYATNAFPFVKPGAMSSRLPTSDVKTAAGRFLRRELEIVRPTLTIALGHLACIALKHIDRDCIRVPHPAARIGGDTAHEQAWRSALSQRNSRT